MKYISLQKFSFSDFLKQLGINNNLNFKNKFVEKEILLKDGFKGKKMDLGV